MQKLVSKYALAAHLAVMAVAPLFLLPFAGSFATATVLLWLSAFGFIWLLMEPSRRRAEMPHNARMRVGKAVLRDPLFWFSLVLIVYAGVRALNGGIRLAYDAELMVWSVQPPVFSLMPGCVDGSGYFPFVAVVAVSVIFQAARHALGRSARAAFLLVGSVLSALAALVLAFAVSYQCPMVLALAQCPVSVASYLGTAFGLQLLGGVVALFSSVENKWMKVEPFAVLGLVGNSIGLVLFSPSITIVAFLAALLLMAGISFPLSRKTFEGSGSFRCALAMLLVLLAPALYAMATSDMPAMGAKVDGIKELSLFEKGFLGLRETLSAIALKTWKANPWIGTGLSSFPMDIRFMAAAEDWAVVSPSQQTALNGFWQLLAERGVIGALMIAVAVGMLLWTYVVRLVGSFSSVRFGPEHVLGPLVLVAIVALSFVDCSFLRPEVLLISGAFIACSGGALPERAATSEEGKEN